jgi:hypothetical protein
MSNKFESFLKAVGHDFKIGLDHVLPIAQAAVPAVSIINPGVGALLQTSVGVALATEQKFAAMGQQSGTGQQKLAEAVSILNPIIKQVFPQFGDAEVQNYVNAVVALLNALPRFTVPEVAAPAVSAAATA